MKKIDWYIIRKVLEKTADQQELRLYREWLGAARHHREYMEKISCFEGYAPELAEDELEQGLKEVARVVRQRKRKRLVIRWNAVAAMVCLAFGMSLYFIGNDEPRQEGIAMPELAGAVTVTLPNGKVYNLEEWKDTPLISDSVGQGKELPQEQEALRVVDVPRGKSWQLTLEDGTEVYLNAHTRFAFSETMTSASERRVELLYGEAYFKVKKDASRPFVVAVGKTVTQVYGTQFNVNGYCPEFPVTTLIEGSVGMGWSDAEEKVRLLPGQQASPGDDGKFVVKNVDAEEIIAWKENVFLFKNTTLEEITMRLGDWYGVDFHFAKEQLKKECLYCRLPRTSSLETILEALSRDGAIRFTYQDGVVTVY